MTTTTTETGMDLLLCEAIQERLRQRVKNLIMDQLGDMVDKELEDVSVTSLEAYRDVLHRYTDIRVTAEVKHES